MKKKSVLFPVLLTAVLLAACTKSDEYKKYTENGETLYTGKLDSIQIYSGRLRVKVIGIMPADPKITKTKVTWNSGADSAVFNITKGNGSEMFSRVINVAEGIQNFVIQNFDAAGNASVKVNAIGTSYGPRYESTLTNRPVANAEVQSNGSAILTWDSFDTTSGGKGTWIRYTRTNNAADSVYAATDQATTVLPDFKSGTSVTLRTRYIPTPTTIDTFYAAPTIVGVSYDITAQYIQNAGINFTASAGVAGDRWQTPANWITTADVRNGDNGRGGLDNANWLPSKALSIEAWWGMTPVPNGKIYQTFTLPAGKYTFVASAGDVSTGGTKYITVAAGATLPDAANVPASALAFKLADKYADNKLSFTLTASTQVSVGMQSNMPAEGNFFKVFKFRLYGLP